MYPDPSGPEQSTIEHNLFAENGTAGKTVAGNGNGLYSSEARNLVIRENLFRDNGQTLAIDTRTITQGGIVGGGDVSFVDNVSVGGDGPVFASVRGLTIADNTIEAGGGTRGLYLGGNEQDDVHVLRNTINGFSNIGIYLKQSNPGTPQNGDVEIRQNTITNGGTGILLTNEASQGRLEIEHNRIVNNADGGLTNNDPDVVIDARHNWWGCNAGPNLDPGCGRVTSPSGGSLVPYAPWMVLTLAATPMPQYAADRSTLLASVDNLSDGTTPAGPFFLTGQALFGSTPAGTHVPPTVPLVPADVSAQSAYTAGTGDPDELRTTVDNQTVRIKIYRPARPDVVPTVTPDDSTVTPGEKVTLLVGLVNQGNAVAAPVRACLRLSEKLDAITGLCRTIARLRPGHPIARRIVVRVRRRACAGELTHRVIVRAPGLRARVQRAIGRVIADPCTNPPCESAASARRDADTGARDAADALLDRDRPRAHAAC
jgi:Right handed beta helix region